MRKLREFAVLRPALWVAVPWIAGILLRPALPPWPLAFAIAAMGLAVAGFIGRQRVAVCLPALAGCLLLLGAARAQLELNYFAPDDISQFVTDDPAPAEVELRLLDEPRLRENPLLEFGRPLPKQEAAARVLRVRTDAGWQAASGQLMLQIDPPDPRLREGQTLAVAGHLSRPAAAMNPGQFDWAARDRARRLLVTLNVPRTSPPHLLADAPASPARWLARQVRLLLDEGFSQKQTRDAQFLRLLLLGDNDPHLRETRAAFGQSGAAHLLSTSGLHLAILAAAILALLRLCGISPSRAMGAALLFVVMYGLVVSPSIGEVRAVILCLGFGIGLLIFRHADRLNLLAMCAIAALVLHPLDLYEPAFQLTFGLVLFLLLAVKPVIELVRAMESRDMRVAAAFGGVSPFRRLILRVRQTLAAWIIFSLCAFAASAPLVAAHWEQLNPWAVAAGVVLFPLMVMALLGGGAKIVCTLLLPGLAHTWASAAALPVRWLRASTEAIARLPGASCPFPVPPLWAIFAWYALLLLAIGLLHRARQMKIDDASSQAPRLRRQRNGLRLAASVDITLLLLLPAFVFWHAHPRQGETRITLLAIGAGQMAVIETPSRVLMIDDGSSTLSDPLHTVLEPFLRHEGQTRVDAMLLSHPDLDHISAAAGTVTLFGTHAVYTSPFFAPQSGHNHAAAALRAHLSAEHESPRILCQGQHLQIDSDTAIDLLWPPPDHEFSTTNEAGLVVRLTAHGRRILFPADIQTATEGELLQWAATDPDALKADVLMAPHHGSAESTTAAFVRAVNPKWIVASNAQPLSHKQVEFNSIAADRPLYRTNQCGAITIHISESGELWIETFKRP